MESGQPYENIVRLKLKVTDGKMRETDVANTKELLRLIQSVPSPNAEPFKQWLAQMGKERLEEIETLKLPCKGQSIPIAKKVTPKNG